MSRVLKVFLVASVIIEMIFINVLVLLVVKPLDVSNEMSAIILMPGAQ